ncbi:MAG: chemotaxis protein CheW [Telluria sp.]
MTQLQQACWKRIGVHGDRTCDQLERHVHCRNCPTYSEAAQRTIQLPVEPAYREFWAGQLRQPREARAAGDTAAMVFRIGVEWLALPAAMVLSVAPLAAAHRLPHRNKPALLGVVNIGGRLAPAIALAPLLGINETDAPPITGRHVFGRLLVVGVAGHGCALPVAELHGIVRYASSLLAEPAATVERPHPQHLAGVLAHDAMLVGVLNGDLVAQRIAELLR